MTFAASSLLWAAALIVPLALLYLRKVRPRKRPVTALFLWQQVFTETATSKFFQKLRDRMSLLLVALAFAAMALAMAEPEAADAPRQDVLLIVDRSASMSASADGTSQLDRAKDDARSVVRALGSQQRAAVATLDRDLSYRAHLSDNPQELLEAIDAIEPSPLPADPRALAALAKAAAFASDRHRVLLFSDGALGGATLPDAIELVKVDALEARNTGILAADLQRLPSGQLGLYLQLGSTFDSPRDVVALVRHDNDRDPVKVIPLTVEPGANPPITTVLADERAGRWRVELDVDDALAADDRAHLVVPPARPVRVQVLADQRFFLDHSVLAFGGGQGLTLVESGADVVLSLGDPGALDGPALVLRPEGESPLWVDLGEPLTAPIAKPLVDDHPALRWLDVTQIPFVGARDLRAPEGSLVLAATPEGVPLVYRAPTASGGAYVVNTDPTASDLFVRPSFPVLVHGLTTDLAGRGEPPAATVPVGGTAPTTGARLGEPTRVTAPDGSPLATAAGRRTGALPALGFYRLANGSGESSVGVSLLAAHETLYAREGVEDTSGPIPRGRRPSTWLALFALLLLVGEGILYHRRKVG